MKDPDAILTYSDASVYIDEDIHKYVSHLSRTDPTYTDTNYYLSLYRMRLMVRAAQGLGPPYPYCP